MAQNNGNGKKIGLLGGTFDPIHMTHLHMAAVVLEECKLDGVWFLPAPTPPHKQKEQVSTAQDRLHMVKLAIENTPNFYVNEIEFQRKGPSYTVDTIAAIQKDCPEHHFSFIIGADMVADLPNWHDIERLIESVSFVAVGRPQVNETTLHHNFYEQVQFVDMLPSYLSSTEIRLRREAGKTIQYLVPEKVFQYIEEKQLYV